MVYDRHNIIYVYDDMKMAEYQKNYCRLLSIIKCATRNQAVIGFLPYREDL
jgi:hypothetical protein